MLYFQQSERSTNVSQVTQSNTHIYLYILIALTNTEQIRNNIGEHADSDQIDQGTTVNHTKEVLGTVGAVLV